MPELPEVETIVRGLQSKIVRQRITRVQVCGIPVFKDVPADFSRQIKNQSIQSVERHGKSIYIQLDKTVLRIHLGMTGQLLYVDKSVPLVKHTHVIFHFDKNHSHLRYVDIRRFGEMEILLNGQKRSTSPDAWNESENDLFLALRKKNGFIKHALLNQNVIAGLGNIYVDESLYKTGIHPKKKLERLPDFVLKNLCTSIKSILATSIQMGGTSFRNYVDVAGKRGGFKEWLHVYGKEGRSCPVCGVIIRKTIVASRGTHFCPQCQPLRKKIPVNL